MGELNIIKDNAELKENIIFNIMATYTEEHCDRSLKKFEHDVMIFVDDILMDWSSNVNNSTSASSAPYWYDFRISHI